MLRHQWDSFDRAPSMGDFDHSGGTKAVGLAQRCHVRSTQAAESTRTPSRSKSKAPAIELRDRTRQPILPSRLSPD